MNPLYNPPIKETPFTTKFVGGSIVVDSISSAWMQWFSDLTRIVNNMHSSGTTASRPSPPYVGYQYFDTTLGKPIWASSATTWVDATGAAV